MKKVVVVKMEVCMVLLVVIMDTNLTYTVVDMIMVKLFYNNFH